MKEVVQYLTLNSLHFSAQKLTRFQRTVFVSGHVEPVIKPITSDADSTNLKKATFIASFISETVFSCPKGISNDKLAF